MIKFWKKKPEKWEALESGSIDGNKITALFKYPEAEEFLKLLKITRDNAMRLEMLSVASDKTALRKGEVIAYEQLIANISMVRKEEISYARKSE